MRRSVDEIRLRVVSQDAGRSYISRRGDQTDRVVTYGRMFRESGLDLELVELYHHRMPRESAVRVEW